MLVGSLGFGAMKPSKLLLHYGHAALNLITVIIISHDFWIDVEISRTCNWFLAATSNGHHFLCVRWTYRPSQCHDCASTPRWAAISFLQSLWPLQTSHRVTAKPISRVGHRCARWNKISNQSLDVSTSIRIIGYITSMMKFRASSHDRHAITIV